MHQPPPSKAAQRWASFVSLAWYDGFISFLFRFVAKTSEPLLAAGVIVSAADFLQKGALMAHNLTLASAWAWTQALAIEASTGPVLVFALSAFRTKDTVKGWLYTVLATLLFVVGGAMLLLQLGSNVAGLSEAHLQPIVLYLLFVLRVVVSAGMVALSCTKHLRFSGLLADETPVAPAPSISEETVALILAKLARLDALEQRLAQPVMVVEQPPPVPQLAAPVANATASEAHAAKSLENLAAICDQDHEQDSSEQPIYTSRFTSKEQAIAAILQRMPDVTPEQVAAEADCTVRTAEKWMQRLSRKEGARP